MVFIFLIVKLKISPLPKLTSFDDLYVRPFSSNCFPPHLASQAFYSNCPHSGPPSSFLCISHSPGIERVDLRVFQMPREGSQMKFFSAKLHFSEDQRVCQTICFVERFLPKNSSKFFDYFNF